MKSRIFFSVLTVIGTFVALLGCGDGYECSKQKCANGKAYQRCVLCYDANACTFQSRNPDDDVLSECDYETSPGDTSERDACFDKVNAAAEKWCSDS